MIQSADQLDRVFGPMDALADATRLRLLRLIERQELGVAELCDVVQLPQSTVSRHLKLLATQGWVVHTRRGTTHLYRLNREGIDAGLRQLWELTRQQTESWATLEQDRLRLSALLKARRGPSASFFRGAAADWDGLRQQVYGSMLDQQLILGLLPTEWTVVDLGCGTGTLAATLAPHVDRVIGIDDNDAMLDAARRRTEGLANVEVRPGSLEDVPVESDQADAVVMGLVLAYLPEPSLALEEAARITRPGGRIVVLDLLVHDREDFQRQMGQQRLGFEPDELVGLMTEAGWTRVTARPLPPEPGATGPATLLAVGTIPS